MEREGILLILLIYLFLILGRATTFGTFGTTEPTIGTGITLNGVRDSPIRTKPVVHMYYFFLHGGTVNPFSLKPRFATLLKIRMVCFNSTALPTNIRGT